MGALGEVFLAGLLAALHCGGRAAPAGGVSVLAGSRVRLGCLFDPGPEPLERRALTVEWNVVDRRGEKSVVYTFEDGRGRAATPDRGVDEGRLLGGDASLLLRNVTVESGGLYSCRVITPVVHTQTTALEVLARPSVSLPERAEVTAGEEKTIRCDVTGYYPEKVDVTWQVADGSRAPHAALSEFARVCTELPSQNPDGTFSVRSGITLHSSAVKGGGIHVICQVEHQSLHRLYNRSVMLTVRAVSPPAFGAGTPVTVSAVTLLLAALLAGLAFVLYKHLSPDAPSVSPISQPDAVFAGVPAELKCTIRGASPRWLKVTWFKMADADPEAQAQRVCPLLSRDVSDRAALLTDGRHHTAVLSLCLPVTDDRSEYQCQVLYRGRRFTRETAVRVKVKPSFLQISSIPQIPKVERTLLLCCRVENFYPPEIHLEWSRNDGEEVRTVTHFGPFSDRSPLSSVWSKIQLLMAREDERAVFTCRVYHCSFSAPGYKDVLYHVNTQGTPPRVMFIDSEPLRPLLGRECTLHLCIKDFCPRDVSVTWSRDGEAVTSGVFNTPPSLNVNGLYSMFSFLKLTPAERDGGRRFSCQVVHSAQRGAEERVFTLPPLLTPSTPELISSAPQLVSSSPPPAV